MTIGPGPSGSMTRMKPPLLPVLMTAAALSTHAADKPIADYVAHEWGTFTSLQGADGEQIVWRPHIGADLPSFVYTHTNPNSSETGSLSASMLAKRVQSAKQRMETPVIYFYSPDDLTVDVEVAFSNGRNTEWYPRVSAMGPTLALETTGKADSSRSFIRWDNVHVLGAKAARAVRLPDDRSRSHYYAARETDSNLLRFDSRKPGDERSEFDKFLFYRGLGHFDAPLNCTLNSDETMVTIQNNGQEALTHLFLIEVRNGAIRFERLAVLKPRANHTFRRVAPKAGRSNASFETIKAQLADALTESGLYRKEAEAMVKTWRDSWLEEDGLRVLYVLSDEWTERTLPLNLNPRPKDLKRVMVGRAEMILPSTEWRITRSIALLADGNAGQKKQAVAEVKALRLGRFLEPVLRKTTAWNTSPEFQRLTYELQIAVQPPVKRNAALFFQATGN